MKENWERTTPHIDLAHATLTDLIQPALPKRSVISAELLTGGLANTLYKIVVDRSDDAFVVRLYTRDPAACQKDCDIFDLIHRRVPLPELLYADPTGNRYPVPYAIMRFVPGPLLRDVIGSGDPDAIEAAGRAVGRVRAAMSAFTFDRSGFFGAGLAITQPLTWDDGALRSFVQMCLVDRGGEKHLGAERTRRLWRLVEEHAVLINEIGPTNTLVHADFNPPNVLMQHVGDQWDVAAVLDWEFAFAGPALFDIAMMLRHDPTLRSPFATQLISSFADHGGYVPIEWRRLSRLLDLFNLCDFLAKATGATVVRDVVGLIDQMIVQWDGLRR